MNDTPRFANPPIVELVLGVQFSPLTKLTSGHFGLFWKALGDDWEEPSDGPILEDQFELFDRPRWGVPTGMQFRLEPVRFPGRFVIGHKNKDRLIQMQATRFHLNWRKRPGGVYLSYGSLIAEFEATFAKFESFARDNGLGKVLPNQWELTYIDAFPKGDCWQTPADWSKVLPGLFGDSFVFDEPSAELEHRAVECGYEIKPRRGRLHVVAQAGRTNGDERDALLLQMTARGPVGGTGASTFRKGLDLGHETAVKAFLGATSDDTRKKWGAL